MHKPPTPYAHTCVCGASVYFHNSKCLNCNRELGYDPDLAQVVALGTTDLAGQWAQEGPLSAGRLYYRCANFHTAASCNWLRPANIVPAGGDDGLCLACSLNRNVLDQTTPHNQMLWGRIEVAKRRLVSQLLALDLPVQTLQSSPWQNSYIGMAFDLLLQASGEPPVITGHHAGVITLDAQEADDRYREQNRQAMQEPYRTLLGHMRHEVGHYYWNRLVMSTQWLKPFRAWFGDEQLDYTEALNLHYSVGPPADWALRHVSAYASSHPWEDWAETWAHYLHMRDTMDTARSFGLDARDVEVDTLPFDQSALYNPHLPSAQDFLDFVNNWMRITRVLNELSRSMGERDFYPFVLPHAAVAKLQIVHEVVTTALQKK